MGSKSPLQKRLFALLFLVLALCACGKANLSREQVLETRKHFKVEVLSFDASQRYGVKDPVTGYNDYVRLRITNGSNLTLPFLTVLTKRFGADGKMIGSTRVPAIPADNIKPGETVEYDYYPTAHFDNVARITVEVEQVVSGEDEQFFIELQP